MADLASPDRHITAKDMECLKEAFALFDRDRDGEINTEELGKVNHLKSTVAESNGICTKINQNPDSFKILMEKSKAYIYSITSTPLRNSIFTPHIIHYTLHCLK